MSDITADRYPRTNPVAPVTTFDQVVTIGAETLSAGRGHCPTAEARVVLQAILEDPGARQWLLQELATRPE